MRKYSMEKKLHISLSREHKKFVGEIEEIFSEFNPEVSANYMRLSANDLPMQIIIEIGKTVAAGLSWELLKLAFKKLFQKHSDVNILLIDDNHSQYIINNNFEINLIVSPDEIKDFEDVKSMEDLEHVFKKGSARKDKN